MKLPKLIIVVFTASLVGCTSAPERPANGIPAGDPGHLTKELTWLAEEQLDDGAIGLSVSVVDAQKTIWEAGFGFADADRSVPVTADTAFEVASIGKLFTAVAVMQLVEDGLVELDGPLELYLPSFEIQPPVNDDGGWERSQITLRTLLTHRAGIPGMFLDEPFSDRATPFEETGGRLRNFSATLPPNTMHQYSNNGFRLLAHMVQVVTGLPFEDFVEQEIFAPVGMSNSSFVFDRVQNVSVGFMKGEAQEPSFPNVDPSLSLRTTAHDLALFMRVLLSGGGDILAKASIEEMWSDQGSGLDLDLGRRIGLGFELRHMVGVGEVVGHGGDAMYFSASISLSPSRGLGTVALANSKSANPTALRQAAMHLAVETFDGDRIERPPLPTKLPPTQSRESAESLKGTYQSLLLVSAEPRGSDLVIDLIPGVQVELNPTENRVFEPFVRLLGLFSVRPDALEDFYVVFHEVADKQALSVHNRYYKEPIFYGFQVPPADISKPWLDRMGHYESTSRALLVEGAELRTQDGVMCIDIALRLAGVKTCQALEVLDENRAVVVGLGRNHGNVLTARNSQAGVELDFMGLTLTAH